MVICPYTGETPRDLGDVERERGVEPILPWSTSFIAATVASILLTEPMPYIVSACGGVAVALSA